MPLSSQLYPLYDFLFSYFTLLNLTFIYSSPLDSFPSTLLLVYTTQLYSILSYLILLFSTLSYYNCSSLSYFQCRCLYVIVCDYIFTFLYVCLFLSLSLRLCRFIHLPLRISFGSILYLFQSKTVFSLVLSLILSERVFTFHQSFH